MTSASTVLIHGSEWKLADIEESVADCRGREWKLQRWVRRDALVQRTGTTSLYISQKFDSAFYDLVRGGWSHDHCEICWWELSESDDEAHSLGYTDGRHWICSECYQRFIKI
jgi:hypothetical protein